MANNFEPLDSGQLKTPMSFQQRMNKRLAEWCHDKGFVNAFTLHKDFPPKISRQEYLRRQYLASLVNKSLMSNYAKKRNIPIAFRYVETSDFEKINFDNLPENFVVKPNNSFNSDCVMLFYNGMELFSQVQIPIHERSNFICNKLKQCRFTNNKTKVIIEEYVKDYDPQYIIPRDFKVYAAGGAARLIQVIDRNSSKSFWNHSFYDRDWSYINDYFQTSYKPGPIIPPPSFLKDLLLLSDKIASDINCFVRLDFFISTQGPVFGEFTFYPFAGLNFTPYGNNFLCQLMDKFPDDFLAVGRANR
jgi:hypothetical protein